MDGRVRAKLRWNGLGFILMLIPPALFPSHAASAITQEPKSTPIVLPRLEGPILLDGMPDEPGWDEVEPLSMVQHLPDFGQQPSECTQIRVAYDDDFIYVGAWLHEDDVSGIQPGNFGRDRTGLSNDWVAIVLDTFNDKENSLVFAASPTGSRTDVAISNDGEGDRALNPDWNSHWDVEVAHSEKGWSAELRIPFSSLRFQDEEGVVVMGMILFRWIARNQEAILAPAIPPNWRLARYKASQAQEVEFHGIHSRNPVQITPYGLTGVDRRSVSQDNEAEFGLENRPQFETGLDVKYGLASHLTLDLTVNTDFAQVEADDEQVNLSRFSLFFPEKRQFFQEQQSAFEFETGGVDRVFHSRQIGLREGLPLRIYGGARIVGQIGRWEVGTLNLQTASVHGARGENLGTMRLRRRILNRHSHIGAIGTSRISPNERNLVYGLDGRFQFSDADYLTLQGVYSIGRPNIDGEVGGLFRIRWERRGLSGLGFDLSGTAVEEDYTPGLGFILRTGHFRVGDRISYSWMPGVTSQVLRHTLSVRGSSHFRLSDGVAQSVEIGPEWRMERRSGTSITLSSRASQERLDAPFEISEGFVAPAGLHRFYGTSAGVGTPSGGVWRANTSLEVGTFYGGQRISARLSPAWDFTTHLELSGHYQLDHIRLPEVEGHLTVHASRLRARIFANRQLSSSTFVQYNSQLGRASLNARVRYNPSEGNDIFLVWNEERNVHPLHMEPHLKALAGRSFMLKVARTFQF